MNAEAEIDEERRIVLPKELLETLPIAPGTRVQVETGNSYILIQTRPPGLYRKEGMLVYDHGRPLPVDHTDWVKDAREARTDYILGDWNEK